MRREDNFQELVKNKKIIIPIIQRDYAQGRNNTKAISVRTRLIDEWIDILQDSNLRMDFNYIYGNETGDIFYPVDGQQRLTSLYLLHWYLAMATDNTDEIDKWQFDYKTRNSASEFFAFLHDAEKSAKLFKILHSENKEDVKQADIRNDSWFKTKWENDPTVVSCVNFLCMLSGKLSEHKDQFGSFWERLNDTSCPAVYFTCLNECDDEYAEIDAAKKYTRMNARGKRLTNFENLKAMIDEIEMKHISKLAYCSDDEQEALANTISWTYDRDYINCMFNSMQEGTLIEKTKAINDESEKWFKLVYYVYALVNGREIPGDLVTSSAKMGESYEDVIYKVSQERVIDDKISEYLYMLKAVFEVLCNSGEKLAYRYNDFTLNDDNTKIDAIAFVLLITKLWNKKNSKADNAVLITKWEQLKNALRDLGIYSWKVLSDKDIVQIVSKMVEGISNCAKQSVDEYFITNDFNADSPFTSWNICSDIKCRILERKIKSKLIVDGAVHEADLDEVPVGSWRWGYLYYISGFLSDWNLNNWSGKSKWNGAAINAYTKLIKDRDAFEKMMNTREAKVVFAYASQYDSTQGRLRSSKEINDCNNEHIWKYEFLKWEDNEYGGIAEEKIKMLHHLKVMFDLLLSFKSGCGVSDDELIEKFIENINSFFDSNAGYEECWLRYAAKYPIGGKELLTSELRNENGVVMMKSVPVIIRTYLVENGYSYIEKITRIKDFNKRSNYFKGNENRILYAATDKTCTFAPDADNSGKYQHSRKTGLGWDLSGNNVNRNMDLSYKAYLDLSGIGKPIKNNFWSVDITGNQYTIKVYEILGKRGGKLAVQVSEADINHNSIVQIEGNILQWEHMFDNVEKDPANTGNYDHWIELWNNDYQTAFGPSFVQGAVNYDEGKGQRPKKAWSEVFTVPALNWRVSTVDI
jgi:hypothetical protein